MLMRYSISLVLAATLISATAASAQEIRYLSPEEALTLEHQTRFDRMRRIAQENGVYPAPDFRDYTVAAAELPPGFPQNVPVLRIVFPENAFFDTASANVKPQAAPIVRAMAAMLDGDVPDVVVFVAGHADNRGGDVYNHNLSVERANAVASLLNNQRTRAGPLWSIGFGKSIPLYPNTTEANLGYNRRVELLLSARVEAIATWLQDQVVDICRTTNAVERLRCMTDFKRERKMFEAQEVLPRPVRLTERQVRLSPIPRNQKRSSQESGSQRVTPITPAKIRIRLNEKQIRVQSIEH